jgi:hydrogenase-4 membrane subunit HyfE
LIHGLFLAFATMFFIVAMTYLGGGSDAIRRQLSGLALVGIGLVVIVPAVPILSRALGDLMWGIARLVLNAAYLLWFMRARNDAGRAPFRERQSAALVMPGAWNAVIVYVVVLVIGSALLIVAARAGL